MMRCKSLFGSSGSSNLFVEFEVAVRYLVMGCCSASIWRGANLKGERLLPREVCGFGMRLWIEVDVLYRVISR